MLVVRLQGGLGNQMFQYATGKKLAIQNNTTLKLDLALLHDHTSKTNAVHRFFDLDIFKINFNFATSEEIVFLNGKRGNTIFQKIGNLVKNKILPKKLIIENGRQFHKGLLKFRENICIAGAWQSYRYFIEIREQILLDFEIKQEFLAHDTYHLYKELIVFSDTPVCVHIRRGDYVSNSLYNDLLGVLDIEYYNNALIELAKYANNLKLFVFSDDIDWCRENLNFEYETVYVNQERSKRGVASDLKLMSLCKHNIISNSTFAWWGAWLSQNKNKIVIAPKNWVNKKYLGNTKIHPIDILPEEWIKIE